MGKENAFSGIFSKKPSTQQNTELQMEQEDTHAIKEQATVEPSSVKEQTVAETPTAPEGQKSPEVLVVPEQQPLPEEVEPEEAVRPIRKRGRRRKDTGGTDGTTANNVGHFSCICDKDLIAKVRAIAWQEHMTVRAVVEGMFAKCITKYEKKRGPIQIEPSQPSEELF